MRRSYALLSKIAKDYFAPELRGVYANMKMIECETKEQDGNSCGIYVLRFFEKYLLGEEFTPAKTAEIDFFRLKYLHEGLVACDSMI